MEIKHRVQVAWAVTASKFNFRLLGDKGIIRSAQALLDSFNSLYMGEKYALALKRMQAAIKLLNQLPDSQVKLSMLVCSAQALLDSFNSLYMSGNYALAVEMMQATIKLLNQLPDSQVKFSMLAEAHHRCALARYPMPAECQNEFLFSGYRLEGKFRDETEKFIEKSIYLKKIPSSYKIMDPDDFTEKVFQKDRWKSLEKEGGKTAFHVFVIKNQSGRLRVYRNNILCDFHTELSLLKNLPQNESNLDRMSTARVCISLYLAENGATINQATDYLLREQHAFLKN